MATLTFHDGAVWDNNSALADKYSTRTTGARTLKRVLDPHDGLKSISTAALQSSRLTIVTGTFAFDTSYPTGGEDISEIWNLMPKGVVLSVLFDQPNVAACRTVKVDTGTKKLLGYTDGLVTQVVNTTNLSAITGVRFIAVGY